MNEYIKFYFHDFLNSGDVQGMDTTQVGAYCLLLFSSLEQKEKGYLPINDNILREITRMHITQWNNNKQSILKKFSISEKGYYNKKMIKVLSESCVGGTESTDIEDGKPKEEKVERYHGLQEYVVKNFSRIPKMEYQLTYIQCESLAKRFKREMIERRLRKMENWKGLLEKPSVFYTLEEFCINELKGK